MQLAGCKVISKKYVGLIDTVLFPGILISNTSKYLHKEIIKALKSNQNFDTSLVQKKLVKKFSVENNLKNWTNLFDKIYSGNEIKIEIKTKNYLYNLKWLREINRLIKKTLPFGKFLPEIDQYLSLAEKIFNKNFIKY